MKRVAVFLVITGMVFLVLGCAELLTMNLASGMDAPQTPSAEEIAEMDSIDLLDTIEDLTESDTFYEDLAADETLKEAFTGSLIAIYNDEEAPLEQQQDAALLAADIALNSTDAGLVVDRFVDMALGFAENPPDLSAPEKLVEDILGAVFEGIALADFAATIGALQDAAVAYTEYGENLDVDETGTAFAPPDDNIGAIAQSAVVSIIVNEMLTQSNPLLETADLQAFVEDPAANPLPAFTLNRDPFTDNDALGNILEASGLGDLLNMGDTI